MLDYLKYDNSYWTDERRLDLRKRLMTYMLMAVIAVEGIAISKQELPWKMIDEKFPKILEGALQYTQDFPLWLAGFTNYYLQDKSPIDGNDLSDLLDHPSSKANIRRLLDSQKDSPFSEVGGAVFTQGEYLNIVEIDNPSKGVVDKVIKNRKDHARLKEIFTEEKKDFLSVFSEPTYERFLDAAKTDLAYMGSIMTEFLKHAEITYTVCVDDVVKLLYPGQPHGDFIGLVHVHKNGTPPSPNDFENNISHRSMIISPNDIGYTFYEIVGGEKGSIIEKDL